MATGVGGALVLLGGEFPRLASAAHPLGSFFAFMLPAGALALAGRRPPRALYAAALAQGAARLALAFTGRETLSFALCLAVEPAVVLSSAWIALRMERSEPTLAERLLPAALLCLAGAGVGHTLVILRGASLLEVALLWIVVAPPAVAVQLRACSDPARRALRQAREELEERVRERTAELGRSEERYRIVSELSSDFSFAVRVDAVDGIRTEWVTDAFERITGHPPEVLEGWAWLELLGPQRDETATLIREAQGRGQIRAIERTIRNAQGEERVLHIEVRSIRGDEGRGVHVVGAARDVTEARRAERERRALEQRVQDAERLDSLGSLTGGIAHDFNNLLAVVLGNVRLAREEAPGDSVVKRLERIRVAAEHAARLTEQMLTYSGKASFSHEPCDVSELVAKMAELLEASVADRCRLASDLAPAAVVEGDPTRLRQVVLNLVTNASEALAEGGGLVTIRTWREEVDATTLAGGHGHPDAGPGPYVVLEVEDDGHGMDDETRRRVFEPFFTTRFSGRGLGLASVLGIVRAHGGIVLLRSRPGRGTRVRVLLPSGRALASTEDPAPTAERRGSGRILVIDDDAGVLELAREFLVRSGHEVRTARGGLAGLEAFRAEAADFDAVVLDLSMPDVSGEEVFLALRALRPDLPVVLATGYSEELAAQRFRARGISVVLRKPYEPEALVEAVGEARRSV